MKLTDTPAKVYDFTNVSIVFEIKGPIPSKKNSYEVHMDNRVYKALMQLPAFLKGVNRRWWVGPSAKLKEAETLIAWTAKSKLPILGNAKLAMAVKTPLKNDLDNLLGVILDGIEKSGRINNDRQFQSITIVRDKELKHTEVQVWTL